jgi:hypothetical protein
MDREPARRKVAPGLPKSAKAPRARGGRAPWWHHAALCLLMLGTLPFVNAHIRSDGNEYYAYLRSLAIDHDLHFDNEYAHAEDTFQSLLDGDLRELPTGYRRNLASVGPAMFWTPFFYIGDAVAAARHVPRDGFSWPYVWACALGTALYAFLGLWLAYRLSLRVASPGAAFLGTVAIWLASSLPVYIYFLPFHAHGIASFTVAWFLWNWMAVRDGGGRWRWVVWGVSAGCVAATHYLNALVLVVAMLEIAVRLVRAFGETMRRSLLFGAGLFVVMLPGLVIRWIIEGSPLGTGYSGTVFYWTDPRLWQVAFASEHGAILWTPVLAIACLGLLWYWRKAPAAGTIVVIVTLAFYYAVAAYRGWHGHSSYGNRFLTALTPVFVIGTAAFVDAIVGRGGRARWIAAWSVAALLIAWNAGLMFQWGTGLIPSRGPVDMSVVVRNQVTVVPRTVGGFLDRYFTARQAAVHSAEERNAASRSAYHVTR